jgi:hypothetical protein
LAPAALEPTPLTILSERVRNAPQDLQASIMTVLPPLGMAVVREEEEEEVSLMTFFVVVAAAAEEEGGFFFVSFVLVIAGVALDGDVLDVEDLVTLVMVIN